MRKQMIFKRYELKYRISREQANLIRKAMEPYMVPDEYGRSLIQSLYLDTPDYRLIRRSMEHPVYKEKLRLRSYGIASEESPVFLELKKKYESVVYKRRMELREREALAYLSGSVRPNESQIAKEIDYCLSFYPELAPQMMISCQREAFFGREDHEFRITFDENLLWRDYDLTLSAGSYGNDLLLHDEVLMEVKTAGAIPLWMTRLLTKEKIYKTNFSKYGTAYQMMNQKGDYHDHKYPVPELICRPDRQRHFPSCLPAVYRHGTADRRLPCPDLHR